MVNTDRSEYIVIVDFIAKIPFGLDTTIHPYQQGDRLRLRPSGRLAKEWLRKGYIKEC